MAAVTQLVPNYLGGVSKLPDDRKKPGEVRQALNTYPDPTFGLTKRPGFKFLNKLIKTGSTPFSTTELDNAKWFYINRDGDETYIGCIIGNATAANAGIHIWNAVPNNSGNIVKATVTASDTNKAYLSSTDKNDYHVLTVQDTSIITNRAKVITTVAGSAHTDNQVATVRLLGVDVSSDYSLTIKVNTATTQTKTHTSHATTPNAKDILTGLKTAIDDENEHGFDNLTVTVLPSSLEISSSSSNTFKVTIAEGGKNGDHLKVFQNSVNTVADLPAESMHDRVVLIKNTDSIHDDYYSKFVANDGTSGPGFWEETLKPGLATGLTASTMPHELVNTGTNAFTFQPITWTSRLIGDDNTNPHPSFVKKDTDGSTDIGKIQQSFFYNNRLGFLTNDVVVMSQAGEFYNFYSKTAQTASEADPIDISCSSVSHALLHGVLPVTQGLLLFSENQQFLLASADGNLKPSTAIIQSISNFEMDSNIDPVSVGTLINFVSKTPAYTRVFGMQTDRQGQTPRLIDVAKDVTEFIPSTIDSLTASSQNGFIALYGSTINTAYFFRTYEGLQGKVEAWFNWQLPGKILHMEVDSDVMYMILKDDSDSTAANHRYHLLSANLSATPEDEIIVTSGGLKLNPYIDLYAKASSVTYDATTNASTCYLPYDDIATLEPIVVLAGDVSDGFSGIVESGFTTTPTRGTDGTGDFFKVAGKDLTTIASKVIVGYQFNYDIILPKTYFRLNESYDYTANLTISRMNFSVERSSSLGFKLKSKGIWGTIEDFTAAAGSTISVTGNGGSSTIPNSTVTDLATTTSGSGTGMKVDATFASGVVTSLTVREEGTGYAVNDTITIASSLLATASNVTGTVATRGTTVFPYLHHKVGREVKVKINGTTNNNFTITETEVTMTDPPGKDAAVKIYQDNWYEISPAQLANEYLANDVPLTEQHVFKVPIHQRNGSFDLRLFSNSPFPVSLTSMMWEGNYSPKYFRRT